MDLSAFNLNETLYWVDYIVFLIFILSVAYVFIFSVASLRKVRSHYPKAAKQYRYVIIIPAWRGMDQNIIESVWSFQQQQYPSDKFNTVVVADSLENDTIIDLEKMSAIVFERSSSTGGKKGAIAHALKKLGPSAYDVLILMNANNTVDDTYLSEINKAFHSGGMAIQTHRVSKKQTSNLSHLSALTEEINNSLFRRGHVNMGFSSSLIGSGMAFNYDWFFENAELTDNTDLTKQLEAHLLKQGIFIEYLEDIYTYDEKIKSVSAYHRQRKEWSVSKQPIKKNTLKDFPRALFAGNFDYCDKLFQWMLPSKVLLLGFIIIIAAVLTYLEMPQALKWWILLGTLLLSYVLAIPDKFLTFRTFWALIMLPVLFISILFNKLFFRFRKS